MKNTHYDKGLHLFELQKYNEAINYFQEHLRFDANNVDVLYNLALCNFHLDAVEKTENLLLTILKIDANYSLAHYLYSNILFDRNEISTSLKHINTAIRLSPENASYFGHKSLILLREKEFKTALDIANQGLAIDPSDVLCLNARTNALTKLNRKEEAFDTIETTLNEDPENEFTHANVGWSNLELGYHKKALEHFKEALKIDPNFEYARQGMVEAIKSKNIVYRMFMKYAFWIQNKKSNNQWLFIIGIYVAYRFAYTMLEASSLSYIAPFLIVLYLTFALGSWLITPISNGLLLFNNYGKYLLSRKDIVSGMAFNILVSTSLIFIILFYFFSKNIFLGISLSSLFTIIPLTYSLQIENKKSNAIGISYSILMLLIGTVGSLMFESIYVTSGIAFFMMVLFTWFSSALKD